MARYVDVDHLKKILDRETLIKTENPYITYYDRNIAMHMMGVLAIHVDGELQQALEAKEKEKYTPDFPWGK